MFLITTAIILKLMPKTGISKLTKGSPKYVNELIDFLSSQCMQYWHISWRFHETFILLELSYTNLKIKSNLTNFLTFYDIFFFLKHCADDAKVFCNLSHASSGDKNLQRAITFKKFINLFWLFFHSLPFEVFEVQMNCFC